MRRGDVSSCSRVKGRGVRGTPRPRGLSDGGPAGRVSGSQDQRSTWQTEHLDVTTSRLEPGATPEQDTACPRTPRA